MSARGVFELGVCVHLSHTPLHHRLIRTGQMWILAAHQNTMRLLNSFLDLLDVFLHRGGK
jgi:hypothetical protein